MKLFEMISNGQIDLTQYERTLLGIGVNGVAYVYNIQGKTFWIRHNRNGTLTFL